VARATWLGPASPNEQIELTMVLARDASASLTDFAKASGLAIEARDPRTRTVRLSGPAGACERAFGVRLGRYRDAQGREFRGYAGDLRLPRSLAPSVEAVLGLDDAPLASPRLRETDPRFPWGQTYTADEVAKLYNFPKNADGKGQRIAIIELGGGYRESDLKAYFRGLGLAEPKVRSVSVDGGQNRPSNPSSADVEVALDVEVAGATAPGAELVVYFAPNTDQGFLDALNAAVHDPAGPPAAVSISWGAPESDWSRQAIRAYDAALADAAALGVNVFTSSGDSGSSDGVNDGRNHADYPASSPHAVGCGGTRLRSKHGQITSEKVWNSFFGGAAGGGYSDVFARPAWQPIRAGRRGVPDISANADPGTGYRIRVDDTDKTVAGTSAVSPLLAGLAARLAQSLGGPIGYLGPLIYTDAFKPAFHDITEGDNGSWKAAPGWDAASGLGSPDGEKLLAALKAARVGAAQADPSRRP
jgi:kumamolisin